MSTDSLSNLNQSKETVSSFFYHDLYKNILFIETIVTAVCVALHLFMLIARPEYGAFATEDTGSIFLYNRWTIVVVILSIYFALTRLDLVERDFAWKLILIGSLLILSVASYTIGLGAFIFPLIALNVGKAIILLERVGIWWVCAYTYIVFLVGLILRNLFRNSAWQEALSDTGATVVFAGGAIILSFQAFIIIVLVAFLVKALNDAKKQMLETQRLSKELALTSAKVERLRIAQDLHDSVGHSLAALKLQLEVAKKLFSKKPEQAKQSINQAFDLSQRALADVRHSVAEMNVQDFNFKESLPELIKELDSIEAISIRTSMDLPYERINAPTGYQLFRVIQEATTNVLKHAQAKEVILSSSLDKDRLTITIQDNGIGFDTNKIESGSGLNGMNQRVENMQGSLVIESKDSAGTTISFSVDLEGAHD